MKYSIFILSLALITNIASAELELTVNIEYPRHIELTTPVRQNSAFEMRTSFNEGEFFAVTGYVGNVSNEYDLTYSYQYKLGTATGSSTGTQRSIVGDVDQIRMISSVHAANPSFTIRSVPTPQLPARFQNRKDENAQQAGAGYPPQGVGSPDP